jgi:hypothetical protein
LGRTSDGPFTDPNGVGMGAFDLRITASDGQTVSPTMPGFQAGTLVELTMQFH